MHENAPLPPKN